MTGGTVAHVWTATDVNGRACVLKVLPQLAEGQGDYLAEREVLAAGHGRAYVELLAYDDARQALLLERLGPKMVENGKSVDEWIDALCELLLVAWEIDLTPPPASLMTAAQKCEWFADFIPRRWYAHGQPCARAVVDEALRFVESRGAAFDPATAIVVHGDAHAWNALATSDGGYKFIDPDPFVAERVADTAVPMREWSGDLLVGGDPLGATQRRCARIASLTNCDPQAVWEWGTIERLSTALLGLDVPHKVGPMRDWFVVSEALVGKGPR
jgi:streptomycin 6-kinase